MRILIVLAALVAAALAYEECGLKGHDLGRIINGKNAKRGEFPWQISQRRIFRHGRLPIHHCGGTLIASNWVLSAAHCWIRKKTGQIRNRSKFRIRVGDWRNFDYDIGEHDIEIEKIIVHKDYRRGSCSISNDIALVKLAKSVDFSSKYIGPACMPNPGEDYRGAKGCWVSGWGRVKNPLLEDQTNNKPNVLQKLEGSVWLGPDLKREIPDSCPKGQIGLGTHNKSACNGDSGGPMVCPSKTQAGRYNIVGIASYVAYESCSKKPTVFTEVVHYLDWIKAHMV